MVKLLAACVLLFASLGASAAECEQFTPYGVPSVEGTSQLCKKAFVVKHYDACKVPLYVAEYLVPDHIGGTEPRRVFTPDYDVPEIFRARLSDYSNSGYDRGHMAPAGDFQSDASAMDESFLLSNAVPQTKKLNRGVWKSIEIRTRALSVKHGGVYVFTGGIFSESSSVIGNGVCVPVQTYKVIINKKTNQGIAFITENNHGPFKKQIFNYAVPIQVVEHWTGINFTPSLSDPEIENQLKYSIGKDMTTVDGVLSKKRSKN